MGVAPKVNSPYFTTGVGEMQLRYRCGVRQIFVVYHRKIAGDAPNARKLSWELIPYPKQRLFCLVILSVAKDLVFVWRAITHKKILRLRLRMTLSRTKAATISHMVNYYSLACGRWGTPPRASLYLNLPTAAGRRGRRTLHYLSCPTKMCRTHRCAGAAHFRGKIVGDAQSRVVS